MLGWAIGFFVAALVAAVFGFGAIASAFSGIAILLFWIFVALFALSLVFSLFGARGVVADGHVGHARTGGGGRTFALVAVAVGVGALVYAWMDNDWSAEQVGRSLDRNAAEITADAGEAIEDAGDRVETVVDSTANEVREDTAQGLDNAEDAVEPDRDSNSN